MTNWMSIRDLPTDPVRIWREKHVGTINIPPVGVPMPAQKVPLVRVSAGYETISRTEYDAMDWRCSCHGKKLCPSFGISHDL